MTAANSERDTDSTKCLNRFETFEKIKNQDDRQRERERLFEMCE